MIISFSNNIVMRQNHSFFAKSNSLGRLTGALLVAWTALAAMAALAQEIHDWCQDHPLFPAPSGFKCADRESHKMGVEEFLLEENGDGTLVEGRLIKIRYYLQKDATPADPAAIISFYKNIIMGFPSPKAWLARDETGRAAGFFSGEGGKQIFIKISARPEEVELTIIERPASGSAG